jgi:hypothetical protein
MLRRWHVIGDLIRGENLRVGAEVGTAEGRLADALLSTCPRLWLWAVDDFAPGYATWMGTQWTADDQARNRAAFDAVLRKHKPRLTLLEKRSLEAAAWLEPASLDFVFIDADHSYEAVKADIAAWRTRLRPGGWLTGHDYDPAKFPGVVAAVDEAFPDKQIASDFVWIKQL